MKFIISQEVYSFEINRTFMAIELFENFWEDLMSVFNDDDDENWCTAQRYHRAKIFGLYPSRLTTEDLD